MKECTKCGIEKELSFFNKRKSTRDGYAPSCKACDSVRGKIYWEQNKEAISLKHKAYYKQNSESLNLKCKEYNQTEAGKKTRYKINKKSHAKNPNANKCRTYYNHHKHKITPLENCEHCGIKPKRIEAHHRDYNEPMKVIYLCVTCHKSEHKNFTPLNKITGIFTINSTLTIPMR